jgi:hypothetical protein
MRQRWGNVAPGRRRSRSETTGGPAGHDVRSTCWTIRFRQEATEELNVDAAEAVRRACIEAAEHAYEDAGVRGLCQAGRWEAAIGAMRALDLSAVIDVMQKSGRESRGPHRSP